MVNAPPAATQSPYRHTSGSRQRTTTCRWAERARKGEGTRDVGGDDDDDDDYRRSVRREREERGWDGWLPNITEATATDVKPTTFYAFSLSLYHYCPSAAAHSSVSVIYHFAPSKHAFLLLLFEYCSSGNSRVSLFPLVKRCSVMEMF